MSTCQNKGDGKKKKRSLVHALTSIHCDGSQSQISKKKVETMNCFSFLGFIVDWNGRVCGYMKRVEETLILIASPIFSQGDIKFGSSPGAKIVVFAISWWSVTLPTLTLGAGTTLKLELERTDSLGHHSAYSTNRISFVTLSTSTCYYNILPLSSSMIILTVANPAEPFMSHSSPTVPIHLRQRDVDPIIHEEST